MRTKIFISALIFFFLFSCENSPQNPFSPETPPIELIPQPAANIIFSEGGIVIGFGGFCHGPSGPPYIRTINLDGHIKNVGNAIAENIYIYVRCYDASDIDNLLWESNKYLFIHGYYGKSHLEPNESCEIDGLQWEIDCVVLDGNFWDDYIWKTEIIWENID